MSRLKTGAGHVPRLVSMQQLQGDPSSSKAGAKAGTGVQGVFAQAASRWGVPVDLLWGVYGVETNYGSNLSTSPTGAQGYMQFEPGTAKTYHVDVHNLPSSVFGAAHYLHDLKNQKGTWDLAISAYNAGPAGAYQPGYVAAVHAHAKTWGSPIVGGTHISGNIGKAPGGLDAVGNAIGGVASDAANAVVGWTDLLTQVLQALVDPTKWGEYLANVFAWWVKLVWKALWKYVIAPPIHWSQRAVVWYWDNIMTGQQDDKAPFVTIAFWSLGYGVLYARVQDQPSPLTAAKHAPLARSIRAGQGTVARRSLTKPRDVAKATAPKPTPKESSAQIVQTRTVSATRRRSVKVHSEYARPSERHEQESTGIPAEDAAHRRYLEAQEPAAIEEGRARVDARGTSGGRSSSPKNEDRTGDGNTRQRRRPH